ncbi:MAG: hypothetical protein Q9201_004520 [Fulgogasparrea decipioides]
MASRVLAFGVPSALALGGALTASSLLSNTQEADKVHTQPSPNGTAPQSSPFDFSVAFMGQTLSYKKNQVVAKVKEVGKDIQQTSAKVAETSK